MDTGYLVKGVVIGFSIAAPVGPIGVLCIRRTLAEGRMAGFVSGLGAATADGIYGCIAGFGLVFISDMLVSQQTWLRIIGGLFLSYLGVRTILARPAEQAAAVKGRGLFGAYASTLFLTLTNPVTVLFFAAIFAGMGAASTRGNYAAASMLVAGVFAGSAFWWLALSGGAGIFRDRVTAAGMAWVNRISGVVILGFGLAALAAAMLGHGKP